VLTIALPWSNQYADPDFQTHSLTETLIPNKSVENQANLMIFAELSLSLSLSLSLYILVVRGT